MAGEKVVGASTGLPMLRETPNIRKPFQDRGDDLSQIFYFSESVLLPEYRGKGVATLVLKELEKWSLELNFTRLILETGIKQPEAIGLYTKNEYTKIPNYGQYENVKSSVCFEKYPTFHTDN
jgi:GNAT superfamily N-acetyltransferase